MARRMSSAMPATFFAMLGLEKAYWLYCAVSLSAANSAAFEVNNAGWLLLRKRTP